MCRIARELLTGSTPVGRVIARPFIGQPAVLPAPSAAQDFSLTPPRDTILDRCKAAGQEVMGVGKIEDIFAHRGLTKQSHRQQHGRVDRHYRLLSDAPPRPNFRQPG